MRKAWIASLGLMSSVVLTNCGKHGAVSGPANLGNLPSATGASSAVSTGVVTHGGFQKQAAQRGVLLSELTTYFGNGRGNRAFCSIANGLKNAYRQAERTDRTKCTLAAIEATGSFGTDLYNGKAHVFSLKNVAGSSGQLKIVADKNDNGIVTRFSFWDSLGAAGQSEYFDFRNDDGRVQLTSVTITDNDRQRTVVSGTVNSGGAWTSAKTMESTGWDDGADAQGNRWRNRQHTTLVEASGALDVQDYERNRYTPNGGAEIENSFVANGVVQLLNAAEGGLAKLALGGGTLRWVGDWNGAGSAQVSGWEGDSGVLVLPAASADYFAVVSARDLPATPASLEVGWQGEEAWDLQAPGPIATLDLAALAAPNPGLQSDLAACNATFSFRDDSWIDCHALP